MLIYAIRNTVNGKVYIGQTVRSLEQRWAQHVLLSRVRNMPVCRAIRKHGADKFTRIVLFYAKDTDGVRQAMSNEGLTEVRFLFDHDGSTVLVRD